MNIAEAWETGNGTATTNFHGMDVIIKFVDDNHVDIRFGTDETGYKRIPKSPVWAFKGWMRDLGIDPKNGWEPGKAEEQCLVDSSVNKIHQLSRHNQHKKRSRRSLRLL